MVQTYLPGSRIVVSVAGFSELRLQVNALPFRAYFKIVSVAGFSELRLQEGRQLPIDEHSEVSVAGFSELRLQVQDQPKTLRKHCSFSCWFL